MDNRPLQTLSEKEERIADDVGSDKPLFPLGGENRRQEATGDAEAMAVMRAEIDALRRELRALKDKATEGAAPKNPLEDISSEVLGRKLDAIMDRLGALPEEGMLAPVGRFFRQMDRKVVASLAATALPMGIQALAGAATKSVPSKLLLRVGLPAVAAFWIYEALTQDDDSEA